MKNNNGNDKLYIVLISVHGLIRANNLELGRDADTGGQSLYVVELARALAARDDVARVDLLTRLVEDPKVASDYSRPEEKLSPKANLIRLRCGPRRYLRKEVLWPYLDEFIDHALQHTRSIGQVPDFIHGHYADAGLVAARLAGLLGAPMIFTGHSLGREKQRQLLNKGVKKEKLESQYNLGQRIEAEEIALGTAAMIVASTHQEVEEQYAKYDNYHPSRMEVIPPGVDISRYRPPEKDEEPPEIASELARFLQEPEKPMILALSRADERKNITTLVRAYGESPELQKKANLVIVAGNRDDIAEMEKGARTVLKELLLLIDKYDLYGKVAYPKHHSSDDVPALYRLAARTHGVFVNPALTEPFGLTLIEAAASGLPIVATNDGGPNEIVANCQNGILIDPYDSQDIANALSKALADKKQWRHWSQQGYEGSHRHYSWEGHAMTYLEKISGFREHQYRAYFVPEGKTRLVSLDRIGFTAIDNALFGDEAALKRLMAYLEQNARHIGMGLATGRTLESTLDFLKRYNLPTPDILVTSVGSEIHYAHQDKRIVEDNAWRRNLDYRWKPKALRKVINECPGIKLAPESEQREHKITYTIDPEKAPSVREIKRHLRRHDLHAKAILSEKTNLDLLPIRCSKGLAIRYLSIKWGIPLDQILVIGDSGNDEEMLQGSTLGVVVANHSPELDKLRDKPRIYFTEKSYADGIVEGIEYYNFLDKIRIPND
ncbi:MAG: HAD-IIB family hydrolase [Thiohalophilus sp.]|uniref:HAD-IIB family hydrolase n=1 Tax=Thiohalophilus sp. TaxID=3028392 RepID=UPI00287045BE|nr:HAD-IIB family hydrolase [Thiohalophilus sp.]MDR9436309.1 HAD-IIB family hydrolase [Thiohalophilus sp.]